MSRSFFITFGGRQKLLATADNHGFVLFSIGLIFFCCCVAVIPLPL